MLYIVNYILCTDVHRRAWTIDKKLVDSPCPPINRFIRNFESLFLLLFSFTVYYWEE